ncbi:LOW QUALITY PROTEIN: regulation of nuclear pre-mRNA domain-containing protein 2a [Anguilla rostrata]|uniref:LOW QUALITY PROTEIN: regulation of nuclear pre-mRNA domain-containing protein 2a n=1 Tax=Anguilla rostrata TaxID=7938 RepID=UPI0030CC70C6
MAAGTGAASGRTGRGSSAALQSSLDRRFQGVSNTMESIQGLSNWCIENKKYHNFIVRYWMKWLKKSGASQMLNLFYVANDVIQNCKRKNAMIYRSSFSEVLPEAALLVKDPKVRKSVERILTIWEERSVYPEELIAGLRASLARKAPPSGRSSAPPNPKAALKSKILAEFAPPAFIEKLSQHRRSLEEAELKEKQLAALRVDVCSTEALKRLKDKAGGKKFSKDFEEGSTKLQDFVGFLEQQLKGGPPLLEALGNADVFYEMQYKEVKIIANAYKTFANRVTHLKRKLDALKSTLPGLDDSPVPSPSEDAPSPTGSESPFRDMEAAPGADDLDGLAMDDGDEAGLAPGDVPSPLSSPGGASPPPAAAAARPGEKDNRDVEDMELSEEEEPGSAGIIVEEQVGKPAPAPEPKPATVPAKPLLAQEGTPVKEAPPPATPVTPATPATPAPTLPVNLANVDLGKISSILSSLTSAMKSTGLSPVSRTSPGTPGTPSAPGPAQKPPPAAAAPTPNPLASILSRVEISPESLLSALSKTQGAGRQGISLLQSVAGGSSGTSVAQQPAPAAPPRGHASGPPEAAPTPLPTPEERGPAPPSAPNPKTPQGAGQEPEPESRGGEEREATPPVASFPSSLESKIHKFLQGNPGFRAFNLGLGPGDGQGGGSSGSSPFLATENLDGTPVRDEAPGTPTQDEMMDEPGPPSAAAAPAHNGGVGAGPHAGNPPPPSAGLAPGEFGRRGDGRGLSPTAYRAEPWGAPGSPRDRYGEGLPNSQGFRHPDPTPGPGRPPPGAERFYDRRGATAGEHYPLRPPPDGSGGGGEGGGFGEADAQAPHYQRIQTLVSPPACGGGGGGPAEILGYGGRGPSGERIQTVESIRVIGRGARQQHPRGEESGGRPPGPGWYGEAYADGAHPRNPGPAPHRRPDDPHRTFPFEERGRLPYPGRDPHPPQRPRIPPSDFFSSPPPPIPPPPPPPIPQLPPPPKDFLAPPSSVMVGGVLVPVERPLSQPPPRGGEGEANPTTPPALFKDLPHHGGVKDHFPSRQAPSLHRPPSSMLGRVRDGPSPPPSSLALPSPPLDRAHHQLNQRPPGSPPPTGGLPPQSCASPTPITDPSSAPPPPAAAPSPASPRAEAAPPRPPPPPPAPGPLRPGAAVPRRQATGASFRRATKRGVRRKSLLPTKKAFLAPTLLTHRS